MASHPRDRLLLRPAGRRRGDHRRREGHRRRRHHRRGSLPAGGIGDAVSEALAPAGIVVHRLAVREIPRSGQPDELIDRYGISAGHIVKAVREARKARE
jgi:hypothetical protein